MLEKLYSVHAVHSLLKKYGNLETLCFFRSNRLAGANLQNSSEENEGPDKQG